MWLKSVLGDMGYPQGQFDIKEDNSGCFHWASSESVMKASRHVHVSFHLVKDLVAEKEVSVTLIPTESQVAVVLFT